MRVHIHVGRPQSTQTSDEDTFKITTLISLEWMPNDKTWNMTRILSSVQKVDKQTHYINSMAHCI